MPVQFGSNHRSPPIHWRSRRVGTAMYTLIEKCLCRDEQAWREFWQLFLETAARDLVRMVVRYGLDPSEAEDVANEIYVHLSHDDLKRLRAFRGSSEAELKAWLLRVAETFAQTWLIRRHRALCRDQAVLHVLAMPDRNTGTEEAMRAFLSELEAVLSPHVLNRVRTLLGLDELSAGGREAAPLPERTVRRLKKMLREYQRQSR